MYDIQEILTTFYGTIFLVSLVIGLLPAYIASNKGKDFFTWYIYGVLLFLFAMIHAIVLPEKTRSTETTAQDIKEDRVPLKEITAPDLYKEPRVINLNSPVELASYSIKVPKDAEKAFANIKLQNISNKAVAAVKLQIKCFDAFFEPVQNSNNVIEKSLQDLDTKAGGYLGGDTLIDLQELTDTRKLQVIVTSVLFADGSRWVYSESDLLEIDSTVIDDDELIKLKEVAGNDAVCYAKEFTKFWQCVCGHANPLSEYTCKHCERLKESVLLSASSKGRVELELQKLSAIRDKELEVRNAAELKKAQKKKNIITKVIYIGAPILIAIALLIFIIDAKYGLFPKQGTYIGDDGSIYVGQIKDGLPHGYGEETWEMNQGDVFLYIGQFKKGERNGKGTLTTTSGLVYVGEWKDGKPHGQGKMTLPGIIDLEGRFEDGEFVDE